jgi:hypothetical protein
MAPLVASLAKAAETFLDAASRSELDVLMARLTEAARRAPPAESALVASR